MSIRAASAPNIALIKYWGNRNEELRLSAADSLSMTLDQPTVEVIADHAETFAARGFEPGGAERKLAEKEADRLRKHFLLVKRYLDAIGAAEAFPAGVSLEIRSKVPRGVGLASSAAVFSAIAEAYAGFAGELSRRDVSVLARLGSGSASRSVFGGFSAMIAGEGDAIGASYAEQIAPPAHWNLRDVVIAPSATEKATGSTEGHALARTSPLFEKRLRGIPSRQRDCIDAILKKDFEKLQKVAEEDCLDMHAVMASSAPPLCYLSEETHRIIREIEELRTRERLPVLYTMDAGPTVHLICEERALPAVRVYARAQKNCAIFEAGVGSGSRRA
ncbi:diphosphomevalonate decarboxylase [Candidatus Kaiserbacteria bacterium RIFCSPHIGHO2_02_FULL_59_21]|uniref:diphosphomevalonate decarboxylase n=1 Tax=Candidatus Kaiserbacteria bacterium RIFCSPHIGHO2_02_FULL_59_21 TaxID=1798500 RepID=A0A1F6E1C7_9BACT|nr:MAG: diphosphomevalonate decarboxylase [Candidatus Kaiserbacteria bacterium RIFCSPHIGHO2_01_FULL_58_22]OGG67468.1 MAG: diphosphomevalonate decarboxylase [Candidatus Kaiserbacteria bacterium RIFCSPHIGHO2_02_FULL_59_21]OGG80520.1 MAG: diphosphomevalonate decarboxylase [Candidatus Kaiserbacteria bacterium RIFCSPLOWO2_01_FULL_59_34]OGG86243.1 MAG: diphosphomevalonate decarboxylase [Candidatus Kaiserbacteria bacterium RIFCSPLOWO2_02_FULL_59_19]